MRRSVAAARVGAHERTAEEWDRGVVKSNGTRLYPDGRFIDYKTGMTTYTSATPQLSVAAVEAVLDPRFLTIVDRETIADLKRQGWSLRAIGRELGRPASTIKREIDNRSTDRLYRPHAAQRSWAASRTRPKESKLAHPGPLRDFVVEKLRLKWSPEQICHALIDEYPSDESMRVSHETIYQAIY
ncbi:helix-turn-helix domain-containing protein, partial [Demequina rhizosphaerae]|uniref:helix-turn-helix domain-containing protein n=3 Tax=Demequina rhizosphaerae TaxID=1638985 RepID=UPI001E5F751D